MKYEKVAKLPEGNRTRWRQVLESIREGEVMHIVKEGTENNRSLRNGATAAIRRFPHLKVSVRNGELYVFWKSKEA